MSTCTREDITPTGFLHVEISDSTTRKPLAARVYLIGSDDSVYFAENCIPFEIPWMRSVIGHTGRHFNTIGNTFTAELPVGNYTIRIEKGKEYLPFTTSISIKEGMTRKHHYRLSRWINMNKKGWYSADHHVHRNAGNLPELLLSEDLNFALFQSDWNEDPVFMGQADSMMNKITSYGAYSIDASHSIYMLSHEIEGNHGALFYHIFDKDAYPLPGLKDHSLSNFLLLCQRTREAGGYLELDKPIYKDAHVFTLLHHVDFMEIANNHNLYDKYIPEGVHNLNRSILGQYDDGELGYTRFVFDLYYLYLNAGLRIIPTAGSASFPIANPVGYNRIYVKMEGDPTLENYFVSLKRGNCFVTNGPMLNLFINDKTMGDTLNLNGQNGILKIKLYYPNEISSLEIIHNGKIVKHWEGLIPVNDSIVFEKQIPVQGSGWIAARCFDIHKDGNIRFAHTAPLFIRQNGIMFKPLQSSFEYIKLINNISLLDTEYHPRSEENNLRIYRKVESILIDQYK